MKIIVIGGGAAGFFSALAAKEASPGTEVLLLERSSQVLSKVRISGGGRCNVTNACFDPRELVRYYPRGHKELLGPFHQFQPRDTIEWFKTRGVPLKEEEERRMFPMSNSSSAIVDCFLSEAERLGVVVQMGTKLNVVKKTEKGFELDPPFFADRLILATGSAPDGWKFAKNLGHTVQTPVPSLFTLNIPAFPLRELAGVAVSNVSLSLEESPYKQAGPLLITHWGFSGPAALKLSAFGARFLAERNYQATLSVDWIPDCSESELRKLIEGKRESSPAKILGNLRIYSIPKGLLKTLYQRSGLSLTLPLNNLGKSAIAALCKSIKRDRYDARGKTTNKDEFVTCGGVTLSEVDFKTMESKLCSNLFVCGEILDIDGVTGGFNFQNAWTTGRIAGASAVLP